MKRTIALLYNALKNDKNQTTPYLSTCLLSTLLILVNGVSFLLLLNIPHSYISFDILENKKLNTWLNSLIIVTPIWGAFALLFPQSILETYTFSNTQKVRAKKALIIVTVISISIMTVLLLRNGVRRGLISF